MPEISIKVGTNLSEEDLYDSITEDDCDLLKSILYPFALQNNARAVVDDISVDSVQIVKGITDVVVINCTYNWSAYYGCSDADDSGTEEEVIECKYIGDSLLFEVPEERDMVEEF